MTFQSRSGLLVSPRVDFTSLTAWTKPNLRRDMPDWGFCSVSLRLCIWIEALLNQMLVVHGLPFV